MSRAPATAWSGIWLSLLRSAPARSGVRTAGSAQLVAGGLGASIPSALQARSGGAGVGLGFSWGVTGATYAVLVAGPLVLAALAQRRGPDAVDLYLAGWSRTRQFGAGAAAAGTLCGAGVLAGGLVGALVGLGDAVRHGADPLTAPEMPPVAGWLVVVVCLSTAILLACGLSASASVGLSLGSATAFFGLLPVTWTTGLHRWLELAPMAPAWAASYAGPSYRLLLPMALGERVAVALAWLGVGVALAARGLRPRPLS